LRIDYYLCDPIEQMRLGGLILLLMLSYYFNPIQPIVDEEVGEVISDIEMISIDDAEYLDEACKKAL